jgi:hypothetical protein
MVNYLALNGWSWDSRLDITRAVVPRTLAHSLSVLFSVSASAVVAVCRTTSPFFSFLAAITRGVFPQEVYPGP